MAITIDNIDLKEACLLAAREVIAEKGVEALSMREVSRKLNVSHQAPYRHYPSRDHLLAEIIGRCFEDFARFLDEQSKASKSDPLHAMGEAYMLYAERHPLEYRLMFGTPWPEPANHPSLVKNAVHAFDVLREYLFNKHAAHSKTKKVEAKKQAELEAMFIWSTLHGLATIEQSNVVKYLSLTRGVQNQTKDFVMNMINHALQSSHLANHSGDHDNIVL